MDFDFNFPIPEWLETFDPDIENCISRWKMCNVSMIPDRTLLADLYSMYGHQFAVSRHVVPTFRIGDSVLPLGHHQIS